MKFILELIKMIFYWLFLNSLLFGYIFYIEPNVLNIKEYNIVDNKIANNFKIVHFTDTHIGRWTNIEDLNKIITKINEQNPDLVFFTGDLFDDYLSDQDIIDLNGVKSSLSNIETLYGKFAIIGNHEWTKKENLEIYKQVMNESGFILLDENNPNYYIEDLNISVIGMNTQNKNSWEALNAYKFENSCNLLLLHAPDYIDDVSNSIDYAFAGHTHGGQIGIPFLYEYVLPRGGLKYIKGEYIINNTKLYVNGGTGTTRFPVRFLVPPELYVINMQTN